MHRTAGSFLIAFVALWGRGYAQQADADTVCASVYVLLEQNARTTGISSSGFEAALTTAQAYHLAANPADDPQRYALRIIDSAQTLRDALAEGRMTADTIVGTASSCNLRYGPGR